MKTNLLSVFAVCAVLLVSCNKQAVEPIDNAAPAAKLNYGLSVNDGRLHFATINDFKNVIDLTNDDRRKFVAYVSNVAGFTSRAKASKQMTKSEVCNCALNDDYATAMVNENFMMDIGKWTVKLNGCDQKFYALYREGLAEAEVIARTNALVACDFDQQYHFYEISNEFELAEELSILEEIIGGNPNAGERRCKEELSDELEANSWPDTYGSVTLPWTKLAYTRAWFTGTIQIYAQVDGNDFYFMNHWYYETYDSEFKEKCGDRHFLYNKSKIAYDGDTHWMGSDWWYGELYQGPRIKEGEGSVTVKSVHRDNQVAPHNFNWETPMLTIQF